MSTILGDRALALTLVNAAPKDFVVVAAEAGWCPHCMQLKGEKVEGEMTRRQLWERDNKGVSFLEVVVDPAGPGSAEAAFAQAFGIEAFPTILFFRKGSDAAPVKFEGSWMDRAQVHAWVAEQVASAGAAPTKRWFSLW
jgi:thiol-disulfide isomerase/thioredoxin